MNHSPRALIIRSAGTNCDAEMMRAFRMAGAEVTAVHLDRLIADRGLLKHIDLIGFAGGFSYGDDIGAGRVFAFKVRERLLDALRVAAHRGVLMLGVCNGFQIMVQAGLLPELPPEASDALRNLANAGAPRVALAANTSARFIDDWIGVTYEPDSVCIWTRGLDEINANPHASLLPVAHGEGRFIADSASTLDRLESRGQVAMRYTSDINGSQRAIAGICDPTGRIFGLMPHPERFLDWTRHPSWTRLTEEQRAGDPPGLRIFQNAVNAASSAPIG